MRCLGWRGQLPHPPCTRSGGSVRGHVACNQAMVRTSRMGAAGSTTLRGLTASAETISSEHLVSMRRRCTLHCLC